MNLDEALKIFREKAPKVILVTGPQRSGTTIASRILAEELGATYVDEEDYALHDCANAFRMGEAKAPCVMQGPAISHCAHEVPEDWMVVFMWREVEDIVKSQERIRWGYNEHSEKVKCDRKFKGYREQNKLGQKPISVVKQSIWTNIQAPILGERGLTLSYESLKSSPLWVSKEDRKKARRWHPRSWKL